MSTKHRWLSLLTFFILTAIIMVFYFIRLKPVQLPEPSEPSIEPGSIEYPSVTFVNPMRGSKTPKVTIIVFSDFECTACQTLNTSMEVVLRTYPNEVKHVWKNLPNESAHPLATPAAIAAHCANEQEMFWEYHDELFDRQAYLSETEFLTIANELQLNIEQWASCYDDRETLGIVQKDYEEGVGLGIVATPTIFMAGEQYVGAISASELQTYVEQTLNAE
jgi:protein-disulfide isomerase